MSSELCLLVVGKRNKDVRWVLIEHLNERFPTIFTLQGANFVRIAFIFPVIIDIKRSHLKERPIYSILPAEVIRPFDHVQIIVHRYGM